MGPESDSPIAVACLYPNQGAAGTRGLQGRNLREQRRGRTARFQRLVGVDGRGCSTKNPAQLLPESAVSTSQYAAGTPPVAVAESSPRLTQARSFYSTGNEGTEVWIR
ncbi:hypothetical protein Pan44_21960 [Caulifigura coniformis]|uniref:Uncharacterized protein n=1 Tax=Caulifigura coniformis TaxID=2527983 RepID=A0A517SDG4_9PLAN|nr:hypothetical protein Pan44_21960 [Caulifigura coniformis]